MPLILAALVIGGVGAPVLLWDKGLLIALASAPLGGSLLAGAVAVVRVLVHSRRARATPAPRQSTRLRSNPRPDTR